MTTTRHQEIELPNFEYQYAQSLDKVLTYGVETPTRSGMTLSLQHQYFYLKNVNENFPVLHGKKMFPKMALKELMWFWNGRTDIKWLNERGVHYWNQWQYKDGEHKGTVGKSYGWQYRNFNGVDQMVNLINEMVNNPTSRRLILDLWNSADLGQMYLQPCVYSYQFSCVPLDNDNYNIDLHVTQRSGDAFIGVPYDFCIVGWFLNIISEICSAISGKNFQARDVHYTVADYHIYVNHLLHVHQYFKNVRENKLDVINHPVQFYGQSDGEYAEGDNFYEFKKNKELSSKEFNKYLGIIDANKYREFSVSYQTIYPQIKAPVSE